MLRRRSVMDDEFSPPSYSGRGIDMNLESRAFSRRKSRYQM
jgi:hypothetical protein